MTGDSVRGLRERMGLTVDQLAEVLAVNPSTMYRWESQPGADASMGPGSRRLLVAMEQAERTVGAAELGRRLRDAVQVRGGLFAVFILLGLVYGRDVDVPPGASSAVEGVPASTPGGRA